jgi:hypothetical protein
MRFGVHDEEGRTPQSGFVPVATDEDGYPVEGLPLVVLETLQEAEGLAREWVDRAALSGLESGAIVFEMPSHRVAYEVRARRIGCPRSDSVC